MEICIYFSSMQKRLTVCSVILLVMSKILLLTEPLTLRSCVKTATTTCTWVEWWRWRSNLQKKLMKYFQKVGYIKNPGPWFNIKMSRYQYRKSHCGDKTIVRSSYLHNGNSYTGETASLYWINPLQASEFSNRLSNAIQCSLSSETKKVVLKFHNFSGCLFYRVTFILSVIEDHVVWEMTYWSGSTKHVLAIKAVCANRAFYLPPDCVLSMWGKIMIPMYRLWLHGLYGLHGPRCPLFEKGC